MSVKVERLSNHSQELWSVCFGDRSVEFCNERGARDYAATLKERIEAPHVFPRNLEKSAPAR